MTQHKRLGTTIITITCPYCQYHFKNNGQPELQVCPQCQAKLIVGRGTK